MRYEVAIEHDPTIATPRSPDAARWEPEETKRLCPVRAWVPALSGCFCEAPSEDEALARLPVVIADYVAWLHRHEKEIPVDDRVEVAIVERVETPPGRSEPCLAADCAPASEEDIETVIRRMEYARDDLVALVAPLPDAVLDWPPGPERWSIRGILAHIASAEAYYRTSLLDEQPPREPPEERSKLTLQRERAVAHLRSLTAEQRATVFRPNWPWRDDGDEEWPVRKALRRFIYHERFHTRDIQQTLAWLLTGGPPYASSLVQESAEGAAVHD